MLDDNVLKTLVLCVGHNRDVLMDAVDDFLGDSTLTGLVHRQHYARRLLAHELGDGVSVSGLLLLRPFCPKIGLIQSPGVGDIIRVHGLGRLGGGHALLRSTLRDRSLRLRTNSWLGGLSNRIVRLQSQHLAGFPEKRKSRLEARC